MRSWIYLCTAGIAASLLPGCGGGGGAPANTGGSGTALTWDQRRAVMEQARQKFEAISATGDLDAQNQTLLDYVKALPGVKEATVADRCITVSFADGSPFLIVNNRLPAPSKGHIGPRAPARTRAFGQEIPTSRTAILLNTVGVGFDAPNADIAPLLQQAHYDVREIEPTLDNLKNLGGAGIVYYSTHGGTMWRQSDGLKSYCLWTASPVGSLDQLQQQWLDEGLIAPVLAASTKRPDGTDIVTNQWGITQRFVSAYWANLDRNSLVFLDACGTDHDLMTAEVKKVASVFLTWSGYSNDGDPARYLFDRLLGTNAVSPVESPPQRPFDIVPVWQEMKDRGLTHNSVGGDLMLHEGTPGQFGLLAPTVTHLYANEPDEELIIMGIFGTDPGDRSVTVGGVAQPVKDWQPNQIRVFLPKSGAGSAGDVVVTSRGHQSNTVQLTQWRGRLVYRFTAAGGLAQAANLDIHIRADVHDTRSQPGAAPALGGIASISGAPDSAADCASSGSYTYSGNGESYTVTWSGGVSIPWWNNTGTPPATYWHALGSVDPASHKLQLGILATAAGAWTITTKHVDSQGKTTTTSNTVDFALMPAFAPDNQFVTLTLGSDWSIVAGGVSSAPIPYPVITGAETAVASLSWGNIAPTYPPRPDAARSAAMPRR